MALDEDLNLLHQLTELGEKNYRDFLEKKADEILFKSQHPFMWMLQRIIEMFS